MTTPSRKQLMQQAIGRRQFLGGAGALGAAVALGGPAFLASCSSSGGGGASSEKSLLISQWPLYIDKGKDGTVARFIAATGIKTTYHEDYNDNNDYFAKIQPILSTGGHINPDTITPTYWLTARLIGLGWVDKLPLAKIPNAKNLVASLQKPGWDPTGEYSLPWQSGMTGIAYNREAAGGDLKSINDIFDPKYKGKIGVLTEMRDTLGLLMLGTGKDPSKATFADAAAAFEKLDKAQSDGQIRRFTGNDYQDDLVAGNFAACIGWSGDVAQLALENDKLRFAIPEEGGMKWSDTMVMPKGAKHVDSVAAWMNFVYDPANAAKITASVQYVSPVAGVQDELKKLGGDSAKLADSPYLFPDDATSARLHVFANISEDEEAKFQDAFDKIKGGGGPG